MAIRSSTTWASSSSSTGSSVSLRIGRVLSQTEMATV